MRLVEAAEVAAKFGERPEVADAQGRWIRRRDTKQRTDRHRHVVHQMAEPIERFRVGGGVPGQLASGAILVAPLRQILAVRKRCDGAFERKHLESVPWQFEVTDDLRAQQTDHVREDREREPGQRLLAHRRAADAFASLQHQDATARLPEIRSGDQSVVAAAHDDDVVLGRGHARLRSGLKKGSFITRRHGATAVVLDGHFHLDRLPRLAVGRLEMREREVLLQ